MASFRFPSFSVFFPFQILYICIILINFVYMRILFFLGGGGGVRVSSFLTVRFFSIYFLKFFHFLVMDSYDIWNPDSHFVEICFYVFSCLYSLIL